MVNIAPGKIDAPKLWVSTDDFYKNSIGHIWYKNILVIQDEIIQATFSFFRKNNIRSVSLPSTTGAVTSPMGLGSDSLPVKINLEGVETYLADSMQFHLEYMLRFLKDGVHYVMPTFRGEKADARHLCQFYHSEAEIVGNLADVMELVEGYLIYTLDWLLKNAKEEIMSLAGTVEHIEAIVNKGKGFNRITLNDAVDLLKNDPRFVETTDYGFKVLTSLGEKELIRKFNGIVWVTHFDVQSVPFYQAKADSGTEALNADLLFGIGEVVGCGERHEGIMELRNAINEHQVSESEYEWYLYMKEKFPMKTSGFGMGIERLILFLINHDDIRDVQTIPRFNGIVINP